MSSRVYASRASSPPPFNSRSELLKKVGGGSERPFCWALRPSDVDLFRSGLPRPWLTLVLGSGCLPAHDVNRQGALTVLGALQKTIVSLVAENPVDYPDLPDGTALGEAVNAYASDLVKDRLNIEVAPEDIPAPDNNVLGTEPYVARLVIASMYTTHLYFVLRACGNHEALHRPGHDEYVLRPERSTLALLYDELYKRTIALVSALITEEESAEELANNLLGAQSATLSANFTATIRRALANVKKVENGPLLLGNVFALTELAWLGLSCLNGDLYPGWNDLLLELSQQDDPSSSAVGTPSFNEVANAASALHERWTALTDRARTAPDACNPIYEKVARLLVAEAGRREIDRDPDSVPIAVAHVTSFDMQLELALLKSADKRAFCILFPVHLVDVSRNVAHTRWLLYRVDPNRDPSLLCEPDETQITVLPAADTKTVDDIVKNLTEPVVVRLAGCPAITLPPLHDTKRKELTDFGTALIERSGIADSYSDLEKGLDAANKSTAYQIAERKNTVLRHAIVTSEYDAMHQNTLDLLASPSNGAPHLPGLTATAPEGWHRYWLLLGVQVGDHAIRQRVSHVVSWLPMRQWDPGSPQTPKAKDKGQSADGKAKTSSSLLPPIGTLVSNRIGFVEQDLMYWNRLNIVFSDVTDFVTDIEHITEHVARETNDIAQDVENAGNFERCR